MAARKKIGQDNKHPEPDQSEVRWLISYSDFMMQLVCLFILLYSVSSISPEKARAAAAGRREQLHQAGGPPTVPDRQEDQRADKPDLESVRNLTGPEFKGKQPAPRKFQFRVQEVPEGWLVNFPEKGEPLFDTGSDVLRSDVLNVLDEIGALLRSYIGTTVVTGYAAPAESGDPLRLSQARAEAVVRHLTREGFASRLNPRSVIASGKGATEDESKARRFEILMRVK